MNGSVAILLAAAVVVLAVAVLAIVVLVRRRSATTPGGAATAGKRPRDQAAGPLRGGPLGVTPGDRLEIRGLPYAVCGTIRLVEGDWSWAQHLLDDGSGARRWMSVEGGEEPELVLWAAEPGATVTPGAPTIDLAGRRYTWAESGQARYTAIGETGLPPTGTVRYHDYQAAGGARLSFEAYGEQGWGVARGDRLDPAEVTIRPRPAAG
ncbi:DUF4178 domain-containing protein [Micromonospora sp. GCM10011542]|uniref:DUF4178 domain-containing protein n=1 Tax=Micromonospora sp. GCM10011542 TaxID=3317337 RepID=UPI00360CE00A